MQGRVALEDSHGVVGAEHEHRRAKMDSGGARRDSGEYNVTGRHRPVIGVVLADPEELEPHFLGQHALVDHPADRLGL
jgi:hypothetical protein